MGRKKRRSSHSSTARPLSDKSFRGFTEYVLHGGEGAHRLVLLDDQGRGDSHPGVLNTRGPAARPPGVEGPSRAFPSQQFVRPPHTASQPAQQDGPSTFRPVGQAHV